MIGHRSTTTCKEARRGNKQSCQFSPKVANCRTWPVFNPQSSWAGTPANSCSSQPRNALSLQQMNNHYPLFFRCLTNYCGCLSFWKQLQQKLTKILSQMPFVQVSRAHRMWQWMQSAVHETSIHKFCTFGCCFCLIRQSKYATTKIFSNFNQINILCYQIRCLGVNSKSCQRRIAPQRNLHHFQVGQFLIHNMCNLFE